jgi:hypothetical protein
MVRAAALVATVVLVSACGINRLDKNAPGLIDVAERPSDKLPVGQHVQPQDPGQHVLSVFTGPFFTAGAGNLGDDADGLFQVGLETTIQYTEREQSAYGGFSLFFDDDVSWGANLGWTAVDWGGAAGEADFGALYLEGQVRMPIPVVAAGYAVEPESGRHGPQMTLSFLGMNWLRVNAYWDGTFAVSYGLTIKFPEMWVWSR